MTHYFITAAEGGYYIFHTTNADVAEAAADGTVRVDVVEDFDLNMTVDDYIQAYYL